jgi:enterochelin esterase-like enzyme
MLRNVKQGMIRITAASVLISAMAATGLAQGRGGAGRGGALTGTIDHVTVHGKALEGNQAGDSADRNVAVYLPPSYTGDPARRYPVIYFLHDYGAKNGGPIDAIKEFADKLAALQGFSEPIVVCPDASTLRKETMYSSSATTGDWERFIAEDLVAYIDSHYRTLAKPISRGLAGQSMGGYAALRIGMKRPGVFSSLYLMSATLGAATLAMPEQYASDLRKCYGIAIEIGTKDPFLAQNRQLHDTMNRLHIPHRYEEFEGDYANGLGERLERNLLPFFSKNLAAPANPTSPGVQ